MNCNKCGLPELNTDHGVSHKFEPSPAKPEVCPKCGKRLIFAEFPHDPIKAGDEMCEDTKCGYTAVILRNVPSEPSKCPKCGFGLRVGYGGHGLFCLNTIDKCGWYSSDYKQIAPSVKPGEGPYIETFDDDDGSTTCKGPGLPPEGLTSWWEDEPDKEDYLATKMNIAFAQGAKQAEKWEKEAKRWTGLYHDILETPDGKAYKALEAQVERLRKALELIKEIYECHPDAKTLDMPHIAHLLYAQADDALKGS